MRTLTATLLAFCVGAACATDKETLEFGKGKIEVPRCGAAYEGDLQGGVVTLLPESVVCLAATVVDGQVKLSQPPDGAHPDALMVLKLWYDPTSGKSNLTIHNPLSQFLAYKAHLLRVESSTREYTTTCQVLSRRDGVEWWNYRLAELTLGAFTVSPEAPSIACQ